MSDKQHDNEQEGCTDPNCHCHILELAHIKEFFATNKKAVLVARQRALRMAAIYLADDVRKKKASGVMPDKEYTDKVKAGVIQICKDEMKAAGLEIPSEIAPHFYEKFTHDVMDIYAKAQARSERAERHEGCDEMPENMKDPLWNLFKDKK